MRPCLAAPGGFCGADGPCGHPWTYPAHTRGDLCRTGGPSPTDARRADALLCAPPHGGASSPGPWVTFSPMRKSPKNLPEGRPLWVLPLRGTLRSPCGKPQPPRWGFCHRHRWSCHFEVVRAIGYAVSLGFNEEKYSAVNPWLGRGLVARLDATFGGIRGIGEGGR